MLDVKNVKDFELTSAPKVSSTDERICEQNRIRQLAFKARQKMPKDY